MICDRNHAFGKKRRITAKFVDGKAFDAGTVFGWQDHIRTNHLCNHAASIDITD